MTRFKRQPLIGRSCPGARGAEFLPAKRRAQHAAHRGSWSGFAEQRHGLWTGSLIFYKRLFKFARRDV